MNTRQAKKEARKQNVPARLARLVRLRQIGAPLWVIKTEQIALVLNAAGKRNGGIGSRFSVCQSKLYEKHVVPLMDNDDGSN